jgi:hypothetical protein
VNRQQRVDFGPHRAILGLILVAVVLISTIPQTTSARQLQPQTADPYTVTDWKNWATTAWAYYAPGVGVNSNTGLHQANLAFACFTEWDLATYIFSIIYARKLGLIADNGDWQFLDRTQKVLNFLENRPFQSGTTPYQFYSSSAINPYQPCSGFNSPTDAADSGLLLGALDALRTFDYAYATQVMTVFTRSQSTYAGFASSCCNVADYYGYLMAEGYQAFFPSLSFPVFSAVDSYTGPYTTVEGVSLPDIKTTSEPLVLEIFTEQPGSGFLSFAMDAYQSQKARWNGGSGPLTAWSEGDYAPSPNYIYEWLLIQLGSTWDQWTLTDAAESTVYTVPPLAYTKIAFAFLAIYGENSFTDALVNAVKPLASSSKGFGDGTFENGTSAIGAWGSNSGGFYSDKTNEFILTAAAYVISRASTSVPLSTIQSLVYGAASDSVYVVLPDYTGTNYPSHIPASKCGGVLNGLATDIFAGSYVLGSLAHPQYEVLDTMGAYVSQGSSTCGQPLMSSTYPILAFASFYVNGLVEYYDSTQQTPVYLSYNATLQNTIIQRSGQLSTGKVIVSETNAQRDSGVVDYFVIQAFKDTNGRSVFIFWGIGWTGTYAATVFFVTNILPNIATYTNGWYVYRWNDASSGQSANSIPDAGDTFTLIASGN